MEEGYDDEEQDQHELGDGDDPTEDVVQEIVESDDVVDNAHEYDINDDMMIVTDINDDDDIENPYKVDFVLDDTYDELDEEDDEVL